MSAQVLPIWLHDDTEEDVVGADWHQESIGGSVDSLRDNADEEGLPWHVGDQLTLVAWRPDGREWRPMPDVMVHPTAGPERRKEMRAAVDGIPALVIEVLSETTWRYDQDTTRGKAFGYMRLGVPEILLFDPTGEYLGEQQCMGWQLSDEGYRTWGPDSAGRFQSMALGVAFAAEGVLLRVYNAAGQPIPFRGERARALAEERRQLAEKQRQLAQERKRSTEERRQLAAVRRLRAEQEAEIIRLRAELDRLAGRDEQS